MDETTRRQLGDLTLDGRPLVICDVDEVIVHFTRDLEDYLAARELYLEPISLALAGNVRRKRDGVPVPGSQLAPLIQLFFLERSLHMEPIDGAVDALSLIGERADVVLLTNLPHEAGDLRRRNLEGHGLPYPVITNSGPKGPAVKALSAMAKGPAVFIDDSPDFIASAFRHAPHVHLVHFLHDGRFARHVTSPDYVSLRAATWDEAGPHVLGLLSAGPVA